MKLETRVAGNMHRERRIKDKISMNVDQKIKDKMS